MGRTFIAVAGLLLPLCAVSIDPAWCEEATEEATASDGVGADSSQTTQASMAGSIGHADGHLAADQTLPEPSRFPPASYFDVGFSYQFDTNIEDGGEFSLWEADVIGVYDVDMTHRFSVVTQFSYRADVYSFEGTPDVGGFPLLQWGVVHTPRFQPLAAFRIGDKWRLYVGPVLEFSFEGGSNIREAFRPGGMGAAEWTINDDLRIGLGILGAHELDSKAYVQPILLLDWNISESLAVHMESWTTRGGEIELGWDPCEQFEIAAAVGYRREFYRLAERDDGALPPTIPMPIPISEGMVEDRAYTVGLRLSYLPKFTFVQNVFGDLRIDFDVEGVLAGRFTVRDKGGALMSQQSYDAAPSLGLMFRVPL